MREYEWPYIDWDKLVRFRIDKFKSLLKDESLDAVILTNFDNIRYASDFWMVDWVEGFYEGYGAIFTRDGESYILSSFEVPGETVQSPVEDKPHIKEIIGIPSWFPRATIAPQIGETCSKKLKELGCKRVGMDDVPYEACEILKQRIPGIELKPLSLRLLEARAVKSEEEIRLIEFNSSILDAAAKEGLEAIREGKKSEYDVCGIIGNKMLELGIECISHIFFLSGRPFDVLASHSTHKLLEEGDAAIFDLGFYGKGGYATDMARTGFVGGPAKQLLDYYKMFYDVYFESLEKIKPGVKGSEIDRFLRGRIRDLGFYEYPHCSGHGLGLRVCEMPSIERAEHIVKDMELTSGMVINIEPCVGAPSGETFKIEDLLVVTDTGYRLVTKTEYGI
ncbi:M24 family metallopeptidase [Chloroflexota bacterium]